MLLYLSLVGIVVIFTFLLLAFWISGWHLIESPHLPWAFLLSTASLVASSFVLHNAIQLARAEELVQATAQWQVAFALGIFFGLTQMIGWIELQHAGVFFTGAVAGSYWYLISGLHLVHVLGGLVFMAIELVHLKDTTKDPVKTLVFVTNPYEKLKLKLIAVYWHFMDGLWLLIFLSFAVSVFL